MHTRCGSYAFLLKNGRLPVEDIFRFMSKTLKTWKKIQNCAGEAKPFLRIPLELGLLFFPCSRQL